MKTFSLCVATATIFVSADLFGQNEGRNRERAQGGVDAFFVRMDVNKDGKITAAEAGEVWGRLSTLDTDNDGSVSKAEFAARGQRGDRRRGERNRPAPVDWDAEYERFLAENPRVKQQVEAGQITKAQVIAGIKARAKESAPSKEEEIERVLQAYERLRPGSSQGLRARLERGDVTLEALKARIDGARGRGAVQKRDGDGDGAERARRRDRGPDAAQNWIKEQFPRMDANGDGKLTQQEVGRAWLRVASMDVNGDGVLTKVELGWDKKADADKKGGKKAGNKGGKKGDNKGGKKGATTELAWFVRMDTNADGKITVEEAGDAWAKFAPMDANKDGAITPAEAGAGERRAKGGKGRDAKGKKTDGSGESKKKAVKLKKPAKTKK